MNSSAAIRRSMHRRRAYDHRHCSLERRFDCGGSFACHSRKSTVGANYLFLCSDEQNRLQGVVPTRRLLLNAPETLLADIMVREVIVIPSQATILDACEFFALHHLLAFPVVDAERHLLALLM